MTVDTSSGYWTFPTTGVWWCLGRMAWFQYNTSNVGNTELKLMTISNYGSGNTEVQTTIGGGGSSDPPTNFTGRSEATRIFDVTNLSTFKVMFKYGTSANYVVPQGSGTQNFTWFQFIRLGD